MKPRLVCVQTSAYSGATLLASLLGTHPEIASVGEVDGFVTNTDFDSVVCSCGQKIKECGFWRAVRVSMQERGFEFEIEEFNTSFNLANYPWIIRYLRSFSTGVKNLDSIRDLVFLAWPAEKNRLKYLIERNEAIVETVLAIMNKKVFVDTAKDGLGRLQALRGSRRFDIRGIHLIRDVKGVVASRLRRGDSDDVRWLANRWVRWNRNRQRVLKTLPKEKYLVVRYEDICLDLQHTLSEIYQFCGVDPSFEVLREKSEPLHLIGNSMRLKPLSEIKLDERWKSLLTGDQLNQIKEIAGNYGRQYGYY
jgi:hypothetical protein